MNQTHKNTSSKVRVETDRWTNGHTLSTALHFRLTCHISIQSYLRAKCWTRPVCLISISFLANVIMFTLSWCGLIDWLTGQCNKQTDRQTAVKTAHSTMEHNNAINVAVVVRMSISDVNKTFLSRPRPRPQYFSRPRPRPRHFGQDQGETFYFKAKTKTKT